MVERYNIRWSRDELILALYLYCQIPFAKTKANNPSVIELASRLGRTPSSVARKLGNFGAFDPLLARRGISGLTHYSKADQKVWEEFNGRWGDLVAESHELLDGRDLLLDADTEVTAVDNLEIGVTEKKVISKARIGQRFFRRSVLSSYHYCCCVCTIGIPPLLVGSHIIPWSVNEELRLDPRNGLSLCTLHDRSFDLGLITILPDLEVKISSAILKSSSSFTQDVFVKFNGSRIQLPHRFSPLPEALTWHNEVHGY